MSNTEVNPTGLWRKRLGGSDPPRGARANGFGHALYRPRAVLDNGRVFFNAVRLPRPRRLQRRVGRLPIRVDRNRHLHRLQRRRRDRRAPLGVASASLSSGTAEEEAAFLDASERR